MAGKPLGSAAGDFARHLQKMSTAVEKGRRDTVAQAAQVAKTEHLVVMRRDSGGDLRLSGVNRAKGRAGNAKIGARYDIKPGVGSRSATAVIKATGPLQIIANDTSGRVIRSAYAKGKYRRGGKGKSQFIGPTTSGQFSGDRRAVLNIPGIGFRRSARHPGTKGKDTWNDGQRRAAPKVARVMDRETANIVTRGFT
jgi:hypothetical protein